MQGLMTKLVPRRDLEIVVSKAVEAGLFELGDEVSRNMSPQQVKEIVNFLVQNIVNTSNFIITNVQHKGELPSTSDVTMFVMHQVTSFSAFTKNQWTICAVAIVGLCLDLVEQGRDLYLMLDASAAADAATGGLATGGLMVVDTVVIGYDLWDITRQAIRSANKCSPLFFEHYRKSNKLKYDYYIAPNTHEPGNAQGQRASHRKFKKEHLRRALGHPSTKGPRAQVRQWLA